MARYPLAGLDGGGPLQACEQVVPLPLEPAAAQRRGAEQADDLRGRAVDPLRQEVHLLGLAVVEALIDGEHELRQRGGLGGDAPVHAPGRGDGLGDQESFGLGLRVELDAGDGDAALEFVGVFAGEDGQLGGTSMLETIQP